jgi:hypothetical protein
VGSLDRRRLKRLEERIGGEAEEPARHYLNYLTMHLLETIQVHKWGGSVYQATDQELNIVGMLAASNELPEGVGVYTFPSGATVTLTPASGRVRAEGSGRIEVEDLPEGIRPYFARMDPAKQPERERQLYELLERDYGA